MSAGIDGGNQCNSCEQGLDGTGGRGYQPCTCSTPQEGRTVSWEVAPTFRVLNGSDKWEVATTGVYNAHGLRVPIPKGFVTDFATVPRPLRWLVPVNGKHRLPSLLHDCLYHFHVASGLMPRATADRHFYLAMKDAGVKRIKRHAMLLAVATFGASHVS